MFKPIRSLRQGTLLRPPLRLLDLGELVLTAVWIHFHPGYQLLGHQLAQKGC